MFWGAICEDGSVTRPYYSWIPETNLEREAHKDILKTINLEAKERVRLALERATQEGTIEYQHMKERNQKIKDGSHPRGWKRLRAPEQEFKFEEWTRGKSKKEGGKDNEVAKGGIDWFLYREKILLPELLPYVKRVQEANPGKKV